MGIHEEQQIENVNYVLDTSFFIDLSEEMSWTLELEKLIKANNSKILIPSEVKREFKPQLLNNKTDNFGVPVLYEEIEDLLSQKGISWHTKPLRELMGNIGTIIFEIQSKADISFVDKYIKPLDPTDTLLVGYAVQSARKNMHVAIATSDRPIVETIKFIRDVENLEIKIHSPWTTPPKKDTELLVTGNVFGELYNASPKEHSQWYIAVKRNTSLGTYDVFDVAFMVYTKPPTHDLLPVIDDISFIEVFFRKLDPSGEKILLNPRDFSKILTSANYVSYIRDLPTVIAVFKQNPLSTVQKNEYLKLKKAGRLTDNDNYLLSIMLDGKHINWARIEDDHIRDFNAFTYNQIYMLRKELTNKKINK